MAVAAVPFPPIGVFIFSQRYVRPGETRLVTKSSVCSVGGRSRDVIRRRCCYSRRPILDDDRLTEIR